MKIINLFGGPGSGKSTVAAGLFYKMKLRHKKVELVTEYAKELVYDGTLEMMLDRQEVIFAEQNQRLHRLRGKVDYVLIDSPLLFSCVYPEINQRQKGVTAWPPLDAFKAFVVSVIGTYNNTNIFLHRPNHFEEGGRIHNLDESTEIDNEIITTLNRYNMPFYRYGVCETTVNTIIADLSLDK